MHGFTKQRETVLKILASSYAKEGLKGVDPSRLLRVASFDTLWRMRESLEIQVFKKEGLIVLGYLPSIVDEAMALARIWPSPGGRFTRVDKLSDSELEQAIGLCKRGRKLDRWTKILEEERSKRLGSGGINDSQLGILNSLYDKPQKRPLFGLERLAFDDLINRGLVNVIDGVASLSVKGVEMVSRQRKRRRSSVAELMLNQLFGPGLGVGRARLIMQDGSYGEWGDPSKGLVVPAGCVATHVEWESGLLVVVDYARDGDIVRFQP